MARAARSAAAHALIRENPRSSASCFCLSSPYHWLPSSVGCTTLSSLGESHDFRGVFRGSFILSAAVGELAQLPLSLCACGPTPPRIPACIRRDPGCLSRIFARTPGRLSGRRRRRRRASIWKTSRARLHNRRQAGGTKSPRHWEATDTLKRSRPCKQGWPILMKLIAAYVPAAWDVCLRQNQYHC